MSHSALGFVDNEQGRQCRIPVEMRMDNYKIRCVPIRDKPFFAVEPITALATRSASRYSPCVGPRTRLCNGKSPSPFYASARCQI